MIALINAAIFALLGLLHLYWAVGGQWALSAAIPATEQEVPVFLPSPLACVVVVLGLFGFSAYYVSLWQPLLTFLPPFFQHWVIWGIAAIFGLRAIGDFRYVGFFKKNKDTLFARMDTRYYSPLCAWLSLSSLYFAWTLLIGLPYY